MGGKKHLKKMISFLKASALCTHEFDSKSNNVNFPVVFLVPTTCNWPLNFALHHSLLIVKCNLLPLNICKTKKATSLWKSKIWMLICSKQPTMNILFLPLSLLFKGIQDFSSLPPLPEVASENGMADGTRRCSWGGFLSFSLTSVAWC